MTLKIKLFFLPVLLILIPLSVAARTPVARAATGTLTVSVSLTDFGAIGDGITDDGPALQAALDALALAGGGTLNVPAGRYAIITPVAKNFSGLAQSITILGATPVPVVSTNIARGLGLTSEFVIKVGKTQGALFLSNLDDLLIQDVTFIGVNKVANDAKITLSLSEIAHAIVRHCEFYGLSSQVAGGAIVYAHHTDLKMEDSAFLGCGTPSGYNASIIQNIWWRGITITGTRFIDYGVRYQYYGKTPMAAPYSWISIGNASTPDAISARREVVLRDVFLDEGAYIGVSSKPGWYLPASAPIDLIFISGLRMNVTNLGAHGHFLEKAERVFIEKSRYGWSHNAYSAIYLSGVGQAILDQVECVAHAYRIHADGLTAKLTVINSVYQDLKSFAKTTKVLTTAIVDDPVEIVRQSYVDAGSGEPPPSALFYWTSRILNCDSDAQCIDQERDALVAFLSNNPTPTFTLSGVVKESDGTSVAGAKVTLSGSKKWSVQTDSNGQYAFPDLATSGDYTVTVSRANYTFDPPSTTIIAPPQDQTLDFTGKMNTFAVVGRTVSSNGTRIPGVSVTLSGDQSATTTTDNLGEYRFDGLRAEGQYTVAVQKENYDFTPQSQSFNGLTANKAVNFVGKRHTYTISGKTGLSNTLVTLSGETKASVLTASNGTYSFTVYGGGDYSVKASRTYYTFSPESRDFTNVVANQTANFTPTRNIHTISGSTGVAGVYVKLTGDADKKFTTGADGNYSFNVYAGGSYTITASRNNYTFAPPAYFFANVNGNRTANFMPKLNIYTISGSTGLAGVTVTLGRDATRKVITGEDGTYLFAVNAGRHYTVTASKPGYTFSPSIYRLNYLGGNQVANFNGTLNPVPLR